ncbi:hypothetical protein WA158_004995 [Blastocystis sp. Blastoise]
MNQSNGYVEMNHFENEACSIRQSLDNTSKEFEIIMDKITTQVEGVFRFCQAALLFINKKTLAPMTPMLVPHLQVSPDDCLNSGVMSKASSVSSQEVFYDSGYLTSSDSAYVDNTKSQYSTLSSSQSSAISPFASVFQSYLNAYLAGNPIPVDNFTRDQILFFKRQFDEYHVSVPPDIVQYLNVMQSAMSSYPSDSIGSGSTSSPNQSTSSMIDDKKRIDNSSDNMEKRAKLIQHEDLIIPDNCKFKKYLQAYKSGIPFVIEKEDIDKIEEIKSEFIALNIRDSSIWVNIYLNTYFLNATTLTDEFAFFLSGWCGAKKQWKLIYRGTRDGFLAEDFHEKCDNKGETVTVFKYYTNGNFCIFGGYTSISWTMDDQHYSDPKSFIFTLANPNNIPPTQFPCQITTKNMYHGKHLGPNFGTTYNNMGICGARKPAIPPAIEPVKNHIDTYAIIANGLFYSFVNFDKEHPTYGDLAGYGNGLFVNNGKDWNHQSFTSNEIETFARLT